MGLVETLALERHFARRALGRELTQGRWMLDRASSVVCSRLSILRRDVTWLARVPAPNRAMKLLSCAIFFSRCALSASIVERICVLASTMSS